MNKINVAVAIPTYNGGSLWKISAQKIKSAASAGEISNLIIIDSGSKDDTVTIALENDFTVHTIKSKDFNHGGTRNLAVSLCDSDIIVFFTQDAIPQEDAVLKLLSAFDDDKVAVAYGRQLPHMDANPIAQHARAFNYLQEGYHADINSISKMGLKSVFASNSFSAYKISIFKELGGFPSNTILCEDMYYTASALKAGYKVVYVADACVQHSHNYSPYEEFKRYFDIGVFHQDQQWIRKEFGGAETEGKKFILSELKFLWAAAPLWILLACFNNLCKIAGYKLGSMYNYIPVFLIKKFSMHKKHWDKVI